MRIEIEKKKENIHALFLVGERIKKIQSTTIRSLYVVTYNTIRKKYMVALSKTL
jgi:hypothetical protein